MRDQDEALAFYVEKLGFCVHTDVQNGAYRWLTVQHPEPPSFQLGLFEPGPLVPDAATAQTLREVLAKGAMPLVLVVDDCRAAYDRWRARRRVHPSARRALRRRRRRFSRSSGNGWKLIQARRFSGRSPGYSHHGIRAAARHNAAKVKERAAAGRPRRRSQARW